ELECPQDPLPERLKILLELLDAAELRYRRTRERQGSISDDLRIEVEGEDLLVTLPGTSYAVKCSKSANQLYCKEYPLQVDRRSPLSQAEFIGKTKRRATWGGLGEEVERVATPSSTPPVAKRFR